MAVRAIGAADETEVAADDPVAEGALGGPVDRDGRLDAERWLANNPESPRE